MNEIEFGKDLGLMHEVTLTGRKVGFGREDWAKLAHSNELTRATLNFVRSAGVSQFSRPVTENEKIVKLAKLMNAVVRYPRDTYPAGLYDKLLGIYRDLEIVLSEDDVRILSQGDDVNRWEKHNTSKIWVPIAKELLGVEFWGPDGDVSFSGTPTGDSISCIVNATTSIPNILSLIEAAKKEGLKLSVRLEIKGN
jgi:hypothetical protein